MKNKEAVDERAKSKSVDNDINTTHELIVKSRSEFQNQAMERNQMKDRSQHPHTMFAPGDNEQFNPSSSRVSRKKQPRTEID